MRHASRGHPARGLRFRLTLSYVVFFTVLLAVLGIVFRNTLNYILDSQIRGVLEDEWAAMSGYLRIERERPIWFFDREDPDEAYTVERLRRVYMLADNEGQVMEVSEVYRTLGIDSPEDIQSVLESGGPRWRIRRNPEDVPYMIRAGVLKDDHQREFFVAIGRSLGDSRGTLDQFTWNYFALLPLVSIGTSLLGWVMAGRALWPVNRVAQTAASITSSNLSLRIPSRGAGDELDHLIETFNEMIDRLERSFIQMRQFTTDASHELRTPLTAIRGQLEVALFTAQTPEQYREAMENCMEDIERLSQIIRALLLLSQSESGQLTLQKEVLEFSSILREIVEQFQIPAEMEKVHLTADLAPRCVAELDRIQIERLVSNLLSNAIKYTQPGGRVRVTLRGDGRRVELAVEDTGRGIPPESLPHIFERFYRVPDSSLDPIKGLGLGLSFVAWIVKAHNGTIDVHSEPGKGSRFVVSLPVGQADQSEKLAAPEPVAPEKG